MPAAELPAPNTVLERLPDAVVVIDAEGHLVWANSATERLFGESAEGLVGSSAFDVVHPDDLGVAVLSLTSVQEKAVGTPIEIRVRTANGWRLVEAVGTSLVDVPEVAGIVLCLRDLTDRRRWEVASGDDGRFRTLVHNAASILFLLDPEANVHSVSAAITRLLGHDQEQVEGRPLEELVEQADRSAMRSAVARAVASSALDATPTVVEVELRRAGGGSVPFELSIVNLLDDPTVEGLVVSAHDITQLRATRHALEELATHDPLTGLPNRAALEEHLASHMEQSSTVAIFLDLDGFKPINDRYGHSTGDELLRQMSLRLRDSVRKGDLVARYGGDEFVVIATVDNQFETQRLAARLVEAVELPMTLDEGTFDLSASIGMAQVGPGDTVFSVLERADAAMYSAKQQHQHRAVPAG